jgi:glycosyltransferase involved in cell wall biosynthesis
MPNPERDSRRAIASPGTPPPAVSIVLPTYQRATLIGRYEDFELIVVDDGSTDATEAAVARFRDRRLRSLRLHVNRGAAAARNAGIRQATGRFLAFQDSDDEWLPAKLERHMRAFESCPPEVGVVYSDMWRIRRNGTTHYHRSPEVRPGVLIDPSTRFYQVCKLGIQSTVIRRPCLEAAGGFNEEFPALEDLELFVRLSQRFAFHHLHEPLVRYHETDGLSQNMRAKLVARTLLLRLHESALTREDPAFVATEVAALRAAKGQCGGAMSFP